MAALNHYFATVARGLEPVAAQELKQLGAQEVHPDFTGVHFLGDQALLYRVNLWARTLFRVLVPIHEFSCPRTDRLYHEVQKLPGRTTYSPTTRWRCTAQGVVQRLATAISQPYRLKTRL